MTSNMLYDEKIFVMASQLGHIIASEGKPSLMFLLNMYHRAFMEFGWLCPLQLQAVYHPTLVMKQWRWDK